MFGLSSLHYIYWKPFPHQDICKSYPGVVYIPEVVVECRVLCIVQQALVRAAPNLLWGLDNENQSILYLIIIATCVLSMQFYLSFTGTVCTDRVQSGPYISQLCILHPPLPKQLITIYKMQIHIYASPAHSCNVGLFILLLAPILYKTFHSITRNTSISELSTGSMLRNL